MKITLVNKNDLYLYRMKRFVLLSLLILSFTVLFSQDSIQYFLKIIKEEPAKAYNYNKVSFYYSEILKDSCFYYAQKALDLAKSNNDTIEMAKAYANLGESKKDLGQPESVLQNYQMALKLFTLKKDYYQLSRMHNRLGILYNLMGDNEAAIKHYKEALHLQQKQKTHKNIEYIYNNLSTSLYNSGAFEEAIAYLDSAITIYKDTDNEKGLSYANANLGLIYILKKDYTKAKTFIDLSYQIIKKVDDPKKVISSYKLYGMLYMEQNKKQLALSYADSALQASKALNFIEITNATYNFYYAIHMHFKEYDKAIEYLNKYYHINDSLKNIEKTKILAETKVRFDMELNEHKIENLNNENKLNKAQIANQKLWIWSLSIGIALLVIFFVFILFLKKGKYQAEKKLVEKGVLTINDQKPIIKKEDIIDNDSKYESSNLSEEQKNSLTEDIIDLFENQKIYLDPDCSISMLEERLDTNKTYISQVINATFKQNFKSILKEYRIKEATKLLVAPENKNITIEAISQQVGFRSKSVFNTTFKSVHGVTPSFFQKEHITN
jgi:tetratricopeptide (TPR) repeat protein